MTQRLVSRPLLGLLTGLLIVLLAAPGCKLIYRQNTQQGNALEQEDLDELYIGMNKRQVLFVLGTPSIKDPFHDDRWDYVQTFSRRGGPMVQRTVTLRFEDDLLENIIGLEEEFSTQLDDGLRGLRAPAGSGDEDEGDASTDSAQAGPGEQAVEEEAKAIEEPEIEGLGERESETRKYEDGMEVLDQGQED